jgi:NarL family two-component system response regulator LiaR
MTNKDVPIRVIIVDDHAMVRAGLATFLEVSDDLELVGEANSGEEALSLCEKQHPDVVLMDLVMPEMSGVETTRIIRERWPQTQVIVLTSFQEGDMVQDALQAGAISYLLKNVAMEDLTKAIQDAHTGRATLAQEAVQALVKTKEQPSIPGQDLTPREFEVLQLIVDGLNNPEISEHLCISIGTTRTHVSNIFSKMNVTNRAEAITMALRSKLVT